jgi:hypothetical protein
MSCALRVTRLPALEMAVRSLPGERFCWVLIFVGATVMVAAVLVPYLFEARPPDWELAFSGAVSLFAGMWLRLQRRLPPRP